MTPKHRKLAFVYIVFKMIIFTHALYISKHRNLSIISVISFHIRIILIEWMKGVEIILSFINSDYMAEFNSFLAIRNSVFRNLFVALLSVNSHFVVNIERRSFLLK